METLNNGRLGLCASLWLCRSKVRECGLGLLRPRLNVGPVCDDSAAEGGICANVALYK